ncbi:kinase-like protein [Mytilinidion resinicola]|uniref:non-specific serine/threonine protein kinase n=1 Tax=Mytilinidion resinicola TaxID=574789 RepID=A0A6A6YEZ4_9PEZI|nr:kinase-like protein [Mytilinidion resinicola]KAF2807179.1 kinase-like protein [Mytilinidion resinicola]
MNNFLKSIRSLTRRPASRPHRGSSSGFATLDEAVKLEEERMPHYEKSVYYPVRIGDVFQDRYRVLSKLGFGANSTVWFCRDLGQQSYVALKVCITSSSANREVEVFKHIATTRSKHSGASFVRTMQDSFEIKGPAGLHQCLVQEPLLASLHELQCTLTPKSLPEGMLKPALQQIFAGLHCLHSEAHVVHTDLQAKNIMIACPDPTVFEEWERAEQQEPSPRKVDGDRVIYKSREFVLRKYLRGIGRCMIADLGMARIGKQHDGFIQPEIYRAPEVMFCMPWGSAADIWNVGVMIWDLFEEGHMFSPGGDDRKLSNARVLGEMIALLGPPPRGFLRRADETLAYWNHEGKYYYIPDYSLEDCEVYLEGDNKRLFMSFMRKMLQWEPEKRATALKLLQDEWLNSPTEGS